MEKRKFLGYRAFLLFCLVFFCCGSSVAQNISNKGKDFWLGYGNHQRGYHDRTQEMVLYITSDQNTSGKVEIPGVGYSEDFTISANSIRTIQIPQSAYLYDEGKYNTGIHVTAEKPVVIYAHIYNQNVSGATLVLPTNVLGKEYYSINYKQVSNQDTSFSYFFVVAVEDETTVEITPSARTVTGHQAGVPFNVTLQKGEIYQVLGDSTGKDLVPVDKTHAYNYKGNDLTGSRIRSVSSGSGASCKKIAVFSGSGKIGIGCESGFIGSSDNLYQQVYPISAWGTKTITVPLSSRNYDIIRVVKSDAAATVKINGNEIDNSRFVNNSNPQLPSYYEFSSQQPNIIQADYPIQVVQYAVTQGKGINCTSYNENTGDPEMIFLNPVEQNIDHITLFSPDAYRITKQFINVVIETDAVNSFKLDGQTQETRFQPVPGDHSYSYAQLVVSQGVHTLSADKGFNAVAYGFGNAESYGYSAGTNVRGQELTVINKTTKEKMTTGCTHDPMHFSINLQYPVTKLTWNLNNGRAPVEYDNLQPDSLFNENNKTYYAYGLPVDVVYEQPGDYYIEITAEKATSDGCGSSDIIQADFSVYDPPVPDFSFTPLCEGTQALFTDKSNGKGRDIKTWHWDFGDNTATDEQNPIHTYAGPGTYNVTLTVATPDGCGPVTQNRTIKVYKKPVAKFSVSGQCRSRETVFTDQSVSEDGNIVTWIWDTGDNKPDTLMTAAPVMRVFSRPGQYTAKLKVITDKGCEGETPLNFTVYPTPTADFQPPEACLADEAIFTNRSSISDDTGDQLQYLWDFGDPGSGSLNTSVEKDPRHKYPDTGDYTAMLITTSIHGCRDTIEKKFTINGINPKAAFTVENENTLCSRNPVTFINNSEVDFGNITKIVWYFDENNAADSLVDDEPYRGKKQNHLYPEFSSPGTKEYRVRMKAYSGQSCYEMFPLNDFYTITLKAMPEIDFKQVAPVCQEEPPFQLIASQVTSFDKESDKFEGDGVSSSGVFDPGKAGPGVHNVSYIFTAKNGCPDTVTHSITVNPTPHVFAGRDTVIREGTSVRLQPLISAGVVKYEWTPASGLDRSDIASPVASPDDNTVYNLTVTDGQGCKARSAVSIRVDKYPVIPNTFTPNGDGNNDRWVIRYLDRYPLATVEVFNRYGGKVYSSRGYTNPWDGTLNGSQLPVGVYYYIIDPRNGMGPYKGYVTILK